EEEEEEEEEEEDEEALLADEEETTPGAGGAMGTPGGEGEGAQPGPAEEEAAEEEEEEEEAAAEPEPQGPGGGGGGGGGGGDGGVNGAERPQEEGPSGDEAATAETKGEGAQAGEEEEEKSKPAGSDGERRGVKRQRDEKDEHGRAYYEFREEAYNSRSKSPPPPEEEPREGEEDETLVILDTYTSDLHFKASKDRYGGQPLFFEKFPALWAGARSTHGVTQGKICFEAKVSQYLHKDGVPDLPLLRVGWSIDFSCSQLVGTSLLFPPFPSSSLIFFFSLFPPFSQNFEGEELVELSFSKNGEDLGAAFQIPKESLAARPLLPHVLCRSCVVELNFGQNPLPFYPIPPGFTFIHALPPEQRVRTPLPPKSTEECEVLLMVGLPGAGKTQWAQKHSQENREKRFNILGTESVLHQLRIPSPPLSPHPRDAFRGGDQLRQQAAQCLSKLVQIAPRAKRNFILDQCNVYNSGQRRKLLSFKGFSRKVVVIVPPEEAWRERLQRRREAEGDDVPDSVMLEMK
ncbi:Heterogeneous nuclear ribonucleoprotein U-like 2, partial [Calypte anna]